MKWLLALLAITVFLPLSTRAQSPEAELQIQIRAALQEQADEQGYTAQELDELAAALAQNAQDEGISAADVSQTYGFAPDSFETEEEEILQAETTTATSRNPFLIVGGVLILGILSWFLVRSKHSPVSDEMAATPKAPVV